MRLTYLLLLFVHVTDLEPDVLLRQRTRRVSDNVFEALHVGQFRSRDIVDDTYVQTLVELLLLLVNYAEAEVDLVSLFEAWLHAHDLRESFLGMFEGTIAIVEDSYPVPELGFLDGS
jgi:hypothetical protein